MDPDLYAKVLDTNLMEALVTEFIENICCRFMRLKALLHVETSNLLKMLRLGYCSANPDDPYGDNYTEPSSIYLSEEASRRVYDLMARLNFHINNCFEGTQPQGILKPLEPSKNLVIRSESTGEILRPKFVLDAINELTDWRR